MDMAQADYLQIYIPSTLSHTCSTGLGREFEPLFFLFLLHLFISDFFIIRTYVSAPLRLLATLLAKSAGNYFLVRKNCSEGASKTHEHFIEETLVEFPVRVFKLSETRASTLEN